MEIHQGKLVLSCVAVVRLILNATLIFQTMRAIFLGDDTQNALVLVVDPTLPSLETDVAARLVKLPNLYQRHFHARHVQRGLESDRGRFGRRIRKVSLIFAYSDSKDVRLVGDCNRLRVDWFEVGKLRALWRHVLVRAGIENPDGLPNTANNGGGLHCCVSAC